MLAAGSAFVVTAVAARSAHTGSSAATAPEEALAPPKRLSDLLSPSNETPLSDASLGKLAAPALERLAATGLGKAAASAQRRASEAGLSEVAAPILALAVSMLAPGVIGGDDGDDDPGARSSSS